MAELAAPQFFTEHYAQRALKTLNEAALAIASELDVDKVLQLIVDSARELVGAKYSALAVGDWRTVGPDSVHRFLISGMTREETSKIDHWPHGLGLLGAVIHGRPADGRSLDTPEMLCDLPTI